MSHVRRSLVTVSLPLPRLLTRTDLVRSCSVCHKRVGNSVIAIHNPQCVLRDRFLLVGPSSDYVSPSRSGIVTHYQCREQFKGMLV